MENLKTYYLYCLIDPELKIPKYIGISSNPDRRFKDHLKDKSTTPKTIWISSLKEKGKNPILKVVKNTTSVEEIKKWEIKAISKYKDIYELTNSTIGGELDCEGVPINEFDLEGNYLETYNSMTEYCNLHGWPETWATCISAVCRRVRNHTHNRIFRYLEDSITPEDLKNLNFNLHRSDPVSFIIMDLDGNVLGKFNSFQEAYREGFGSPGSLSSSLRGLKGYGSVKGNLICYNEEDFEEKLRIYRLSRTKGKDIKVSKYDLDGNYIETFYSITDAKNSINLKRDSIKLCCEGTQYQCGGFQWRYGDSKENIGKYKRSVNKGKKVEQYTLNGAYIKTWDSVRKASIELNINYDGIKKCADGVYNKSGGFKWKYAKAV